MRMGVSGDQRLHGDYDRSCSSNRHRRPRPAISFLAVLIALSLTALAACGSDRYEPGLEPHAPGPLTLEEAQQFAEGPRVELIDALAPLADDGALEQVADSDVALDGSACLWRSPVHASTADMTVQTWDELTEQVRPAVNAWGMDDHLLDRPERSGGAGLVAENPHNGARLEVKSWNPPPTGDETPPPPGSSAGFSVAVTVPLTPEECQ